MAEAFEEMEDSDEGEDKASAVVPEVEIKICNPERPKKPRDSDGDKSYQQNQVPKIAEEGTIQKFKFFTNLCLVSKIPVDKV